LALLLRITNFGSDRALITPLPFKISTPSVDNIKTEDLTPEQMQNLLSVLDSTHLKTTDHMMKVALFSRLRRGEIFKLKCPDIDFHRRFIHIQEPKAARVKKCH
jgi:integrase